MKHFNQLNPGEAERLAVLSGECAEVIQAISKILRHGYMSKNPTVQEAPNNLEALEVECGHVLNAIKMLTGEGDIDEAVVKASAYDKAESIGQWLHHQ